MEPTDQSTTAPGKKRPGYLTAYAAHAGISKQAASVQLKRVGINYKEPFDFDEADRRRDAARHADRSPFAAPIYGDPNAEDDPVDPETKKDPTFIQSQARRELYKANLMELEYRREVGELIEVETVEREWFRIGRLVRDTLRTIAPRISSQVAAESDPFRCAQLIDAEVDRALDVLESQILEAESDPDPDPEEEAA